jgi:hypothetical protein
MFENNLQQTKGDIFWLFETKLIESLPWDHSEGENTLRCST